MGRFLPLWIVLVCVPLKDVLVCRQTPDTSTGSYERLAEATARETDRELAGRERELGIAPRETTAAQVMDLLKDDMLLINGRLSNLEMKINGKHKGDKP
jgi:hypothetical protein